MNIPTEVTAAIAAAQGSLYGIPGDPDRLSFSDACDVIRNWASDNLEDDPQEDRDDETGEWRTIHYDNDDPWRSREVKLLHIVGSELYPYVR